MTGEFVLLCLNPGDCKQPIKRDSLNPEFALPPGVIKQYNKIECIESAQHVL